MIGTSSTALWSLFFCAFASGGPFARRNLLARAQEQQSRLGRRDLQELDCTFQDDPILLMNDMLSLRHVVNDVAGTITVELTYFDVGWVAFGVQPDGEMVGGEVVIARPSRSAGATNPGKYVMSGESESAVTLMDQQTLINATFEQTETETILRYTKLLYEDGELPIDPTGGVTFIYAAGSGNLFEDHGNRAGSTAIDALSLCRALDGSTTTDTTTDSNAGDGNNGAGEDEDEKGEEAEEDNESSGGQDNEGEDNSTNEVLDGDNGENGEETEGSQNSNSDSALDCTLGNEIPLKNGLYSLKQMVNPVAGTITVEFTYNGEGWVSFGVSPKGKMIGGEVIIAKTDQPASSTNPAKYSMAGESAEAISLMDAQTLIDATWEQTNGQTILRYTKLLQEDGEIAIDPESTNTFIFAAGQSNEFADHGSNVGRVILDSLTKCVADGSSGAAGDEVNNSATEAAETRTMNLWAFHGILMGVAWAILIPIGIGCSLLRSLIPGNGLWFKLHMFSNGTAFLLMTAAFGVAVYNTNQDDDDHFDGPHKAIGLAVYLVCFFQVLAGIFRPHLPKQAAPSDKSDSTDEEDPKENKDSAPQLPQKSLPRRIFEIGHRIVGLTLLGLAWYNCYTGIEEMVESYGEYYNKTAVLWGFVGGIPGAIMLLYVLQVFIRK
jgi:hypothetical protein